MFIPMINIIIIKFYYLQIQEYEILKGRYYVLSRSHNYCSRLFDLCPIFQRSLCAQCKNLPLNLPEPFAGYLPSFLFQTKSTITISALQSLIGYVHHNNLIFSRTPGLVLAGANSFIISSCFTSAHSSHILVHVPYRSLPHSGGSSKICVEERQPIKHSCTCDIYKVARYASTIQLLDLTRKLT